MVTAAQDLRGGFPAARDQGTRPSCLAFAMSDAHAFSRVTPFEMLSAEYLFYHGVQRTPARNPNRGVHVHIMTEALQKAGQSTEADWPYLAALPDPLANWVPPLGVAVYRRSATTLKPSVAEVIAALDKGLPVVISLTISLAFHTPSQHGIVADVNADPPTGCHAVVAVGHGSLDDKRMILVRNSWGAGWGNLGYAWISEQYLTPRMRTASSM